MCNTLTKQSELYTGRVYTTAVVSLNIPESGLFADLVYAT